jgi:hypothetical protein
MFSMDVTKVDPNIVYVAMVLHVCCKLLFPMFHLFLQMYVASVFMWMLHMFHTYVACVLYGCCVCLQRFQVFLRCFCKCFRYIFQVFHISSYIHCKCCFRMFQKQIGCCISLLAFCCLASVSPPPGVGWASDTTPWSGHTMGPFEPKALAGAAPSPSSRRSGGTNRAWGAQNGVQARGPDV